MYVGKCKKLLIRILSKKNLQALLLSPKIDLSKTKEQYSKSLFSNDFALCETNGSIKTTEPDSSMEVLSFITKEMRPVFR